MGDFILFIMCLLIFSFASYSAYKDGIDKGIEKSKPKFLYEKDLNQCYIEFDGVKYLTPCNDTFPYSEAVIFINK